MSNDIICRECNTSNAYGSKFCNHCGTRLPPSTTLICPNCQTPNPRNRFYCDHCGSRIIEEELPTKPETDKLEETEDKSSRFFALPARPPGETGELDPSLLPDWLRTGEIKHEQTDEEAETGEEQDEEPATAEGGVRSGLPKVEELASEHDSTADLPEWLLDENDAEPIIEAPRIITTQHFLDLLDQEKEPAEPEGADLVPAGEVPKEEPELPEWLSVTDKPVEETHSVSDDPTVPPDVMQWLSELSQPIAKEDIPPATEPASEDTAAKSTKSPPQQESEAWLTDAGKSDVDALSQPPETETSAPRELTPVERAIDEWVTVGIPDTGQLAEPFGPPDTPPDEAAAADEDDTFWPPEFVLPNTDRLAEPVEADPISAGPRQEEEPEEVAASISGWLAELGTGELDPFRLDMEDEAVEAETEPDLTPEPPPAAEAEAEPVEAESDSGPLPAWLAALGDVEGATGGLLGETEESPPAEPPLTESGFSWVTEREEATPQEDLAQDFVAQEETPSGVEPPPEEETLPAEEFDWFSELAALDTGELEAAADLKEEVAVEGQPEAALPAEDVIPLEETPAEDDFALIGDHVFVDQEESSTTPDDWGLEESEELLEGELPDWLEQLGPPSTVEPTGRDAPILQDDVPLAASEDLPEWVAGLRPSSGQTQSQQSLLPKALEDESGLAGELQDMAEELGSAELPDWLSDDFASDIITAVNQPFADVRDIPGWLRPDGGLGEEAPVEFTSEISAIFDQMPRQTPGELLVKADIPEWLEALKPQELTGETGEASEQPSEALMQTSGPLTGLHNAIAIEPIIALPRTATSFAQFGVTKEQRQQTELLQGLLHKDRQQTATIKPRMADAASVWTRILLAGILLLAIVLGLRSPLPESRSNVQPPSAVQKAFDAVNAAAGKPVLLAVEYTPALAGELTPQGTLFLEQLDAGGSTVVTVSQFAAGTAVARTLTQEYEVLDLGLLTGEAIGLRQLGHCLSSTGTCGAILGRTTDAAVQRALDETALIIILTGDRDTLVNWIEQAGAVADVPLIAGSTQALQPVAAPYLASGQLQGALGSLEETAAYAQLTGSTRGPTAAGQQAGAVNIARILSAALFLVGGLAYGIAGATSNRKEKTY